MIEHIFIKNYKAFKKENIPLDRNTLLIGSNSSGKTTVLEALDLFFNNVLHYHYIIDKTKDVIVEIHINDNRYRKVYKAPRYNIDFSICIGDMFDINHIKYLYIPKIIDNPKLLNDILTINLTGKVSPEEQVNIFKVSDYIDGVIGNSNYKLFKTSSKYEMNIDDNVELNKEDYCRIVSNITYQHLIIGIDNYEDNFDIDALNKIIKYSYQTIFITNDKKIVKDYNYFVFALYKGNKIDDLDTIKKRLYKGFNKIYLLVEGKYDVNWFETALRLLNKDDKYTVIPCGGSGNIAYVEEQLIKEGFKTIVVMDGDTLKKGSLKRDVIEQYADVSYINNRFSLNLEYMPKKKHAFFKKFYVKDDVVKNVLSRWAKKNLTLQNEFVKELDIILTKGVV